MIRKTLAPLVVFLAVVLAGSWVSAQECEDGSTPRNVLGLKDYLSAPVLSEACMRDSNRCTQHERAAISLHEDLIDFGCRMVNAEGKKYRELFLYARSTELLFEGGVSVLVARGEIHNESDKRQVIPPIRIRVVDAKNVEVKNWTFAAEQSELEPNSRTKFETRLTTPPAGEITLNFSFVGDEAYLNTMKEYRELKKRKRAAEKHEAKVKKPLLEAAMDRCLYADIDKIVSDAAERIVKKKCQQDLRDLSISELREAYD